MISRETGFHLCQLHIRLLQHDTDAVRVIPSALVAIFHTSNLLLEVLRPACCVLRFVPQPQPLHRNAGLYCAPIPPDETGNPHEASKKEHKTGRKRHWRLIESDGLALQKKSGGLIVVRPLMPLFERIIAEDMIPGEHEFGRRRVEDSMCNAADIPSPERITTTHSEKQRREVYGDRRSVDGRRRRGCAIHAGGEEREGAVALRDRRDDIRRRLILTHKNRPIFIDEALQCPMKSAVITGAPSRKIQLSDSHRLCGTGPPEYRKDARHPETEKN